MVALRSQFTRTPRGGAQTWSDGPAGALLREEFFGAAPSGDITGTGNVAIGAPGVAASGTATPPAITGTAAIAIAGPSIAGSGTFTPAAITGNGALVIGAPTLAASGTFTPAAVTGSGALTIAGPTASGSGTVVAPGSVTGTGAASIGGPTVAGSGTVTLPAITGAGAIQIVGPTLSAAGLVTTGPPVEPSSPTLTLRDLGRALPLYKTDSTLTLQAAPRTLPLYATDRTLALSAEPRTLFFWGNHMADTFPEPFDPTDIQAYTFDLTNVLESAENIATATVTADSGLTVGGVGYPNVVGTKTVRFWLSAANANMGPTEATITLTVTTNSTPARRLQRSGIVQVRQR